MSVIKPLVKSLFLVAEPHSKARWKRSPIASTKLFLGTCELRVAPLGPELCVSKMRLKYTPMNKYSQKCSLCGMQGEEEDLGQGLWNGCLHVFPAHTPSLCLLQCLLSLCSAIKHKNQRLLCPNSLELKDNFG